MVQTVLGALWVSFFLLAAGEWTGSAALHMAGGYAGLVTAIAALYLAAAEVLSESAGQDVLPIGRVQRAPVAHVGPGLASVR